MSFIDAVRSALRQYGSFTGRARRSEFWYFAFFAALAWIVALGADLLVGTRSDVDVAPDGSFDVFVDFGGWIPLVVALALLTPLLAVTVRRLHDTGRSGWWVLIILVPVVGVGVLLGLAALPGRSGTNSHGRSPTAVEAV